MRYQLFTRTWWRENPAWPNGLEPCAGHKHKMGRVATIEEARQACADYAKTHKPGRLSRKMEFEDV